MPKLLKLAVYSLVPALGISACPVSAQDRSADEPPATMRRAPAPPPAPPATRAPSVPVIQLPELVRNLRQMTNRAPTEIIPPPEVPSLSPAHTVTLRAGSTRQSLTGMAVKRTIPAASLRSNPRLQLGEATVDFTPLLRDPNALPNVAQRLRAMPDLAEVRTETTEIVEIEQGLVVRNFLAYRLKPGACGDGTRAARIRQGGGRCLTRLDSANRAAAFADPADPHFVADPGLRARLVSQANAQAATGESEINSHIAEFRAKLNNPLSKGQLDLELGAAETARLAALSDDALKTELANSAETSLEQVMFIPSIDQAQRGERTKLVLAQQLITPKPMILNAGVLAAIQANANGGASASAKDTDKVLEPRIFLAGFTLGREYEWRYRIEKTIKWCLVGCKKTYYAEAFAGFRYGLGLRFPIRMSNTWRYRANGGKPTASLVSQFTPIDGSAADYTAAGLPAQQLFSGKEFVAEAAAWAGAGYKLPTMGSNSVRFDIGKDFTELLPPPYANGQFTPPAAGTSNPPLIKVLDQLDLIGGRGNFGLFGAKVFPAIKVILSSDALRFTLTDTATGTKTALTTSGQEVPLSVNPKDQTSQFTIGSPVYNLGVEIIPGINPRLFLDLAVWSDHWDFPVWFPQLGMKLPAGGVDFACHEDTVCTRNYRVSPNGVTEQKGAGSDFEAQLIDFGNSWAAKWQPQCADESCQFGIKLLRLNAVLLGTQAKNASAAFTLDQAKTNFAAADPKATKLIQESQLRLTQKASKGWVILYQAVWSKRCSDVQCIDEVSALADQMGQLAVTLQQQQPDEGSLQIQGQAGKAMLPKFTKAIADSKARAGAK